MQITVITYLTLVQHGEGKYKAQQTPLPVSVPVPESNQFAELNGGVDSSILKPVRK
jgi:hypothetical protein